jgi:hypothetical protein
MLTDTNMLKYAPKTKLTDTNMLTKWTDTNMLTNMLNMLQYAPQYAPGDRVIGA